jgi:hypothetical protein
MLDLRNAKFGTRMGTGGVVCHQLVSDLPRDSGIKASGNIDSRQLRSLKIIVGVQLFSLAHHVRFLGICLGAHGDVFSSSHGHGARNESSYSCDEHRMSCGTGGSDAQNQACGRQNAVVCTHNSGTQPSDSSAAMTLFMAHKCRLAPFDKNLLSGIGIIGKLKL